MKLRNVLYIWTANLMILAMGVFAGLINNSLGTGFRTWAMFFGLWLFGFYCATAHLRDEERERKEDRDDNKWERWGRLHAIPIEVKDGK